jgi:DNA-binding protein YbaB
MLQELILVAVNDATRKVDEQLASQMGNLAGGLTIPWADLSNKETGK